MPQYIEQLLSEADLTPEQREQLKKAASSEKVIKKANELSVPRPDYSTSLDQQRQKFDEERGAWSKEKSDYRKWYEDQKARVAAHEADYNRLKALESGGGAGGDDGGTNRNPDNGQFVSRQELERLRKEFDDNLDKRFNSQGEAVLGVTEDYISLATDYQARFGKRLAVEEVRKKAIDDGTSLRIAYERYIAPEVEKQKQEEFDKKLKEAREEGRREAMTRMHNPANPGGIDGHPVFGARERIPDWKKMTPEQREEASLAQFEKAYNETNGFTKPS